MPTATFVARSSRSSHDRVAAWCGWVVVGASALVPLIAWLSPLGFAPLLALMGLALWEFRRLSEGMGFQAPSWLLFPLAFYLAFSGTSRAYDQLFTVGADLSGELFVTLAGGPTLTLIVIPAIGVDRDLAVRVVSPVADAAARATETAGLTPLRLIQALLHSCALVIAHDVDTRASRFDLPRKLD